MAPFAAISLFVVYWKRSVAFVLVLFFLILAAIDRMTIICSSKSLENQCSKGFCLFFFVFTKSTQEIEKEANPSCSPSHENNAINNERCERVTKIKNNPLLFYINYPSLSRFHLSFW